jgi:deoxyhypusine synthase
MAGIKIFMEENYKHFNARTVLEASREYVNQIKNGNKIMVTLAGAMSTAEIGITLAEMIRQDKVHAITCTGANLEEDVFNLVAHNEYKIVDDWRNLSPMDELEITESGYSRVTDTCISEELAMNKVGNHLNKLYKQGNRKFPHEYLFDLLLSGALKDSYQIDPKNSWMLAAAEKNLPIFVPGWEDSTLGNDFASEVFDGNTELGAIKTGQEYMLALIDWYLKTSADCSIGFFQIGGGIAGDFPICVVPLINCDILTKKHDAPMWSYFCQISDAVTSYGGYSGAPPNEKITWGKLNVDTPRFMIQSDATIVAPLIFSYILESFHG